MTQAEQYLIDNRARTEIAKLMAVTGQFNAETAKISRERFWIPFTIFAGIFTDCLTLLPKLVG